MSSSGLGLSDGLTEREQAAEAAFARSEELDFRARARRNRMLGLWAASLMGLGRDQAKAYAQSVVMEDFAEIGEEDVFNKIRDDLAKAGVATSDGRIRRKMAGLLAIAQRQIKAEA
jgi:hypothetical protein